MSLSVPQSAPHPFIEESIQNKERLGYKGLGYNPALQWLQDYNQARAQLESEFDEQAQKLAHKYDNLKIKLAKNMSGNEWKWSKKDGQPSKRSLQWQAQQNQ